MEMPSGWFVPLLGAVVALAVLAAVLLMRARPRKASLTAEERAEIADAPMPALQKAAWSSFVIGMLTLGTCTAIVSKYGAATYWDDDDLRLTVVMIFIVGLMLQMATLMAPAARGAFAKGFDERDKAVLARSTMVQSGFVLLTLAAWTITLSERFHDQGAIPMVYLNLIFGSVVLVTGIGQAAGVLLGYWMGVGDGQG